MRDPAEQLGRNEERQTSGNEAIPVRTSGRPARDKKEHKRKYQKYQVQVSHNGRPIRLFGRARKNQSVKESFHGCIVKTKASARCLAVAVTAFAASVKLHALLQGS